MFNLTQQQKEHVAFLRLIALIAQYVEEGKLSTPKMTADFLKHATRCGIASAVDAGIDKLELVRYGLALTPEYISILDEQVVNYFKDDAENVRQTNPLN